MLLHGQGPFGKGTTRWSSQFLVERPGPPDCFDQLGAEIVGIQRSSFLVDPGGVLAYAWPRVKAHGHAADVLARLGSAKADRAARSSAG
jgi:hypothetical protein